MFDLTKEIRLEPRLRKKYIAWQIFLYVVFLVIALFILDRILFPSVSLVFSFSNANSPKNTLDLSPATLSSDTLTKGSITAKDDMAFDANPLGIFSSVTFDFTASNNSKNIEGTSVTIRKSYEAFFYPAGSPAGFKDGTLLTEGGSYYIVSDGVIRKFSSDSLISQLGYSKNSFLQISQDDLKYNRAGSNINDASEYPDGTLFSVSDTYYELKNQQLYPFVSSRAFLSQFDANQAILKTTDFLSRYSLSETSLGFADGTLGSLAPSVFILSEGKSYPISNAETFVKKGFDWNDVVPLDSEELGAYARQKQFTFNQPHPDGTLFLDQKTNKYFIIGNGEKHPIESSAIAKTYSKQKPVLASLEESETGLSCQLKKSFLSSSTYSCEIPLASLNAFIGTDFRIDLTSGNNVKIDSANMTFFTSLSWENFRSSLSKIKGNIIINYTQ